MTSPQRPSPPFAPAHLTPTVRHPCCIRHGSQEQGGLLQGVYVSFGGSGWQEHPMRWLSGVERSMLVQVFHKQRHCRRMHVSIHFGILVWVMSVGGISSWEGETRLSCEVDLLEQALSCLHAITATHYTGSISCLLHSYRRNIAAPIHAYRDIMQPSPSCQAFSSPH